LDGLVFLLKLFLIQNATES